MKRSKNSLIVFVLVVLSLLLLCCSERYNELAPFFDGLHLEYKFGSIQIIYSVQALDNKFKIIERRKRSPLSDAIEEYFVDIYGKVYKSSSKDYKGKFSPIWIPAYVMQIGDTFDGVHQVIRKEQWRKWKVVVVRVPTTLGETELYYESNTGFLVGFFATMGRSEGTQVLVNTNADIPVAE